MTLFRQIQLLVVALCLCPLLPASPAAPVLQIKQGYFWDPLTADYFVPRGIAYQVWNPPVGANQSFEQLDYDMLEFKKIYANSVRCEMVWGELESKEGSYDWTKPDRLVATAEKLGLKLFVLIGFQYPPAWFPKELRGINSEGLTPKAMSRLAASTPLTAFQAFPARTIEQLEKAASPEFHLTIGEALVEGARANSISRVLELLETRLPSDTATKVSRLMISDVINWEHPQARALYARHMAAVTARYKDSTAIGAWIMGNEYAYFDLWEDPEIYAAHRFIGYDPVSQEAFRQHLRELYRTNISGLNANWGTAYTDFGSVEMPEQYPDDRNNPAYHDLIQWRKKSIGDFVAVGAVAARRVDPLHLQTYSMVGGVFSGKDANNTAEDARTIVARCLAAGAPLDFWSINNYANAAIGSELRSADFGIGKYQAESGLPVMISETGHSSTEQLLDPDSGSRQAKALPGNMWESLVSGAIGTHVFHWSDRSQYTEKYFLRERGFGFVGQDRKPKPVVYTNMVNMFRRMEELDLNRLLGASRNPPFDVQFFWSTNSDVVWPRANQENSAMWGALKRVGYQPGIIDDGAFETGAFSNAPVLLLSRAFQMNPAHLDALSTRVLPAGVHLHASADLPGRYDAFHRLNSKWAERMNGIFGIDTAQAVHAWHGIVKEDGWLPLHIQGLAPLPPITGLNYEARIVSWNFWDRVRASDGNLIAVHNGLSNSAPNSAALVVKSHAQAKTALNTFALGDTGPAAGPKEVGWDFRYEWIQAIYRNYFGVVPALQVTGQNARYIMPDYRILNNGSILISLLNEHTNTATVTVSAPGLVQGKTVENLTLGGIIEQNSDGIFTAHLTGDDYLLFYIHSPATPPLVHDTPARVWFESAPVLVHSGAQSLPVTLGFDTRQANLQLTLTFEDDQGRAFSQSVPVGVTGRSTGTVEIHIPDADAENPHYRSTKDGGSYLFRATLVSAGQIRAQSIVPVRLAWPVRPLTPLPAYPTAGNNYTALLEWEELPAPDPSDPTPFDRARVWDRIDPARHGYIIALNLADAGGRLVASNQVLTRAGSGTNEFSVKVPETAVGPFAWVADVRPVAALQTRDVFESFEDRTRGANWPDDTNVNFTGPWNSFVFPIDRGLWQNQGVQLKGSDGSQSAFLVVTNSPDLEISGFGFSLPFPGGPWALPEDREQWTNWTFSFEFKEDHGYPCYLELQIKNDDPKGEGKWLQKSVEYVPRPDGWMTVSGKLSELTPPPGLFGTFEPSALKEINVVVRMLKESVQYVGSFDNIIFDGPDTLVSAGPPLAAYSSANDSAGALSITWLGAARLRISWTGSGRLQSAENVNGPWEFALENVNPQVQVISAPRRYYRLLR